jgi:deoxyribodipyrimidine photolyase-related protein
MATIRFILGDQLSRSIATLRDADKINDIVLMAEVGGESTIVGFHKQKLVLIYSAMRHFARELRDEGFRVDYICLDADGNTQSLLGELERACRRHAARQVVVTEPGAWRVRDGMNTWSTVAGCPVEIREDTRFLCSHQRFRQWAEGRKELRMEFFYREMRRFTGLLMAGTQPEGGQWNFDADNREPIPDTKRLPERLRFAPDSTTSAVVELVQERYSQNFGDLEPFGWAVTREDALTALDHFIAACLPSFGQFQDAMQADEPFLFHAIVSPYLNIGLLLPDEVCAAAERAYYEGSAPLNAVEGFIRQILGWREYVRGIYWLRMPDYAASNALNAERDLPWFYWSGVTDMHCMAQAIAATRRHAYAHHIQRLMITGNFALLAGFKPAQVEEWYLAVYIDAYDWVELPNTHGMALFADGGLMASKPYAASGAYINRMSNYCGSCRYKPSLKSGPEACPFNYLYWNFLIENRTALETNPRLRMPYRNLGRTDTERQQQITRDARHFLHGLANAQDIAAAPEQLSLGV